MFLVPSPVRRLGSRFALSLILASGLVGCAQSTGTGGAGGSGGARNGNGSAGSAGNGAGLGTGGGIGGSSAPTGAGGAANLGGGDAGATSGSDAGTATDGGGADGGTIGPSSGGASGGAGSNGAAAAVEQIAVPGTGSSVSFVTSLTEGALYLLKATGSVTVGTDQQDAEFDSAPGGAAGMDSVNGIDVGIDVGLLQIYAPSGTKQVAPGPGRMKWYGGFRADHTYYMVVTGAGKALTLKMVTSGTAASGQIAVSLFLLAATPPATDTPAPGPMPAAPPPNIGTKALETVRVPASKTTVKTAEASQSNAVYLIEASGAVRCGGGKLGLGDAEYDDWNVMGAGANNNDGTCDFGVGVDESGTCSGPRARWWGPYRNDHNYFMLYTGTGNPISFLYFDSVYSDNTATDTITVNIFPTP
jgi:hypothetical protein